MASAGGAIGLLVGGALTQALSWHWIFFINVPIGAATLVLGSILIHERPGRGIRNGVDVLGAVLVTVSAMLLVYAIVEASAYGWLTLRTIGVGAVALVLLGLFVWLEARLDDPMVPLRMFNSRNTTGATVVRLLFPIGMFGNFFIGALYFQHILGYSPVATGLAFLPMNLLIALFSLFIAARLMNRFGARNTLIPGLLLIFCGLMLFVFLPLHASYLTDVLPGMVLFGAGAGIAFSPSVALAMHDAVPGRHRTGLRVGQHLDPARSGARSGHSGQRLGDPHPHARGRRRTPGHRHALRLPPRLPHLGRLHRLRRRLRRGDLPGPHDRARHDQRGTGHGLDARAGDRPLRRPTGHCFARIAAISSAGLSTAGPVVVTSARMMPPLNANGAV